MGKSAGVEKTPNLSGIPDFGVKIPETLV